MVHLFWCGYRCNMSHHNKPPPQLCPPTVSRPPNGNVWTQMTECSTKHRIPPNHFHDNLHPRPWPHPAQNMHTSTKQNKHRGSTWTATPRAGRSMHTYQLNSKRCEQPLEMLHAPPPAGKHEPAEAATRPHNTAPVIRPRPDDIPHDLAQELSTDPARTPTHAKHEASLLQHLQHLLSPPLAHTPPEPVGGAHPPPSPESGSQQSVCSPCDASHKVCGPPLAHPAHVHAQLAQAGNAATTPVASWPMLASASPSPSLSFSKIIGLDRTATNPIIVIVGFTEGHPMAPDPLQPLYST
jgi:hypothetical protein